MTVKSVLAAAALATFVMGTTPASAVLQQLGDVQLSVDYYNMNNGSGTGVQGATQYWDGTYSGSGIKTQDNAPLSGGTGVLTNGYKANDRWDYYNTANGTGQYVGWKTIVYGDPSILFHLAGDTTVHSISFWVDNSYVGLVGGPASIVINDTLYNSSTWTATSLTPNFGNAGGAVMITVAGLNITAQDINVTFNAGPAGPDVAAYNLQYPNFPIPAGSKEPWIFVSEVQFNGVSAVPELSTWAMMLIGFGLFGFVAYRRKLKRNPVPA